MPRRPYDPIELLHRLAAVQRGPHAEARTGTARRACTLGGQAARQRSH